MQFSLIQVKYLESFLQSPAFTQPWHFSGEWYSSLQAVEWIETVGKMIDIAFVTIYF